MQHSSVELLEYEALRALVGRYIASPLGRAVLARMEPSRNRSEIEEALLDLTEAMEHVRVASEPQPASRGAAIRIRFGALPDTDLAASKLRIEGAVLDGREVYDLLRVLDHAADARSLLTTAAERFPRLGALGFRLGQFRDVLRAIEGKVLPDGSLADDASPALHRLRRDIERQGKLIRDSLERFLRTHREEGVLQEEFVKVHGERFVVPVIAGKQGRLDGVIHGSSGSGRTLFLEPLETIHLNNDLVRLSEEEMREVHRILREWTESLRAHAGEIAGTIELLGEIEFLFAKADFGAAFGCVIPRFSPEANRRLILVDARHPLLEDVLRREQRTIVPISLPLEGKQRTLLISGPNTGGKTVTMKTVGLLSMMAQSGLPVPCTDAEFPVFERWLADMGDHQSIEQSLSTFSAHIATIRDILEEATVDSLILLDELGRATDPEEGGALGVALLERLSSTGAFVVASTHLLALKVYGGSADGVVNASMGFDEETLEPTYVLKLGAPGKSAGLDIAGRLGIPAELITRAREGMSSSERDIARFVADLHARVEAAAAEQASLEAERKQIADRAAQLEKDWEQRGAAKIRELEKRFAELSSTFDRTAREAIENIERQVESRKAAEQAARIAARTRREMQQEFASITQPETGGKEAARQRVAEGDRVRLRDVREPARVRRALDDGTIEVEAGFLRMRVSASDVLEVLPAAAPSPSPSRGISVQTGPKWDVSYREVNVIGQRAEEACETVDKFLDSASMASIDRVRIVHGHGMGVLKRAIADLLKTNPHVEKFYPAAQNEGGGGATVVELK